MLNCLCAVVLCSITAMHNRKNSSFRLSTGSGFDLIGPSSQSSVSSDGAMFVFKKNYTYFTLPCRGLDLVGLVLYLVDSPTIFLQCFDTVG